MVHDMGAAYIFPRVFTFLFNSRLWEFIFPKMEIKSQIGNQNFRWIKIEKRCFMFSGGMLEKLEPF